MVEEKTLYILMERFERTLKQARAEKKPGVVKEMKTRIELLSRIIFSDDRGLLTLYEWSPIDNFRRNGSSRVPEFDDVGGRVNAIPKTE